MLLWVEAVALGRVFGFCQQLQIVHHMKSAYQRMIERDDVIDFHAEILGLFIDIL